MKTLFELHDNYYNPIKRFVTFHVKDSWIADDIMQETFLKAQKNIHTLKDPANAKAWLYKIAWHQCLNHFKKNKKKPDELSEKTAIPTQGITIQEKVEHTEMNQCINSKIQLLPDPFKQVLSLFDIEGFSHKEISDILDISIETAKTRLHRARKALKEILLSDCNFERDSRNIFVCVPMKARETKTAE